MRTTIAPLLTTLLLSACSSPPPPPPPPPPAPPPSQAEISRAVFDTVSQSVVAVLNDDRDDREAELKELMKSFGDEARAPKKVVDISLRKEPTPHGTGFVIDGGDVVTAAHVVSRPDRLRLTTKAGQTVDAELVRLDEFRDIAILRPKKPLEGVPPVKIEEGDIKVGEPVWALGHTGQGMWALSWGISTGIASGVVDYLGLKLLVFDAAVYPGFSGGPVVVRNKQGEPRVVGVNHSILFTGGFIPVASISSASSVTELRDVVAGKAPPLEAKLAAYAKEQGSRVYADLFITQGLSVHRDAHGRQLAEIFGNRQSIEGTHEGAFVPVTAMLFHLGKGDHEVVFELHDPEGAEVSKIVRTVSVGERERVSFATAGFRFEPKVHGRYDVRVKKGDKTIGHSTVALSLTDDDDELVDDHDHDVSDVGEPDVDIVVASFGSDDPLALSGISASWAERGYPRRVGFSWFARGTRGFSGTNVAITAFVLDEAGKIVGHSLGCFRPEIRPERPWSCLGTGGQPLAMKEGRYDVVFAINDKPVAMWPMEAAIRTEHAPGTDTERWLKELRRKAVARQKKAERDAAAATGKKAPPGKAAPGKAAPAKPAPLPKAPPAGKK